MGESSELFLHWGRSVSQSELYLRLAEGSMSNSLRHNCDATEAGRSTQLGLTCETFKDLSEQSARAGGGAGLGEGGVCICWQILRIVVILFSLIYATVMFCILSVTRVWPDVVLSTEQNEQCHLYKEWSESAGDSDSVVFQTVMVGVEAGWLAGAGWDGVTLQPKVDNHRFG